MNVRFWSLPKKLMLLAALFAATQGCTQGGGTLTPGTDAFRDVENNYWHYCASCHGRDGKGHGMMASTAPIPPRDHTDAAIMSKRSDDEFFKIIKEGGEASGLDAAMPPHKTLLKDDEIRGLVKYIRHLCNCTYTH